jgi:hypothetical protein
MQRAGAEVDDTADVCRLQSRFVTAVGRLHLKRAGAGSMIESLTYCAERGCGDKAQSWLTSGR